MKTEHIMIKQRSINIAIIIATAVGVLFTVYSAFVFHISRDAYVMANSVIEIAMLAFDLALMAGIMFSDHVDAQITRIFTIMTVFAFFSTFCNLFTFEAYAFVEYSEFARVMYMLSYCTCSIYYGFLWRYIRALDSGGKKSKAWDYTVRIILIGYNLFIISDIFLGVFYKVEAGIVSLPLPCEVFDCLVWLTLYTASFVCLSVPTYPKRKNGHLYAVWVSRCSSRSYSIFQKDSVQPCLSDALKISP